MEDDTEDAYMEVLRYHYKISPIDETFFVLNMDLDDELIKTIYRLHIPKKYKVVTYKYGKFPNTIIVLKLAI